MARLIDADALMQYIRNHDYQLVSRMGCVDKGMFTDGIEHGINIQPTVDAVEVVRCKDCKHWCYEYDDVGLCVTDVPDIDGVQRLADDFCSYGERKDT